MLIDASVRARRCSAGATTPCSGGVGTILVGRVGDDILVAGCGRDVPVGGGMASDGSLTVLNAVKAVWASPGASASRAAAPTDAGRPASLLAGVTASDDAGVGSPVRRPGPGPVLGQR